MKITPYDLAERFIGIREIPGAGDNPQILAMLRLDDAWPTHDEVPWCSAFVNYVAWLLRLPRSKSLSARSWLGVGKLITLSEARPGFDIVILWRGSPEGAAGHVGFFSGLGEGSVALLGGNQGDSVSVAAYPLGRVLGVRRLGD